MECCGSCGNFKAWKRFFRFKGDGKCLAKNGQITVVGSSCYDVFPREKIIDQYVPRLGEKKGTEG